MSRRRLGLLLRRWAPASTGEKIAAGVIAAAVLLWLVQAAAEAGRWLATFWPAAIALPAVAGAGAVVRLRRRTASGRERVQRLARLRLALDAIDVMDDKAFELALRDLMVRDGCPTAHRVGQAGDQCADVIASHPRYGRVVIQAKHTTVAAKVSSHVMYQVNGTAKPVHRADVAVVVTNGSFTRDARAWGDRHGICWIDRERLRRWAEHGDAFGDLLHLRPISVRGPTRPIG
ncbi:restriction endonuclease [Streptomyces sp. NPDC020983]|uniref:restriction endonuclease n=1 Tax=Streptomyces sp. NPDC020983 TaxID=3365106 RepID=UPI0037A75B92